MPDNLFRRGKRGTWYARVEVGGRDVRKSLHTSNLAEARRRLRKKLDEVSHAKFHGEARHTWKAAVGKWTLEYLQATIEPPVEARVLEAAAVALTGGRVKEGQVAKRQAAIKPGTATRYLCSIGQVAPYLEDLYVDEIDRKKIAQVVSARLLDEVTNATIRRDLTAISSVLSCCVAWGWAEENAAKAYDRSVIKERRAPIALPEEDSIDFVVALAPGNFARLIRHAQYTGMREEEIGSLERPQISEKLQQITLTKTKTSRPRVVPMDERAAGTVLGTTRYLHSQVVYWHGEGVRYANIASRFAEIMGRAEQLAEEQERPFRRFRFHDLRHWYAVDYLRRGGNIYTLQKILGHSSIKTTELYLDYLSPDEQHRAKFGPGTEAGTGVTVPAQTGTATTHAN